MTSLVKKLSETEAADFARLDGQIEAWVNDFESVATALQEISDRRLYRERYISFEDYCRRRFDFGRRRAFQILQGYRAKLAISALDPDAGKLLTHPSLVQPLVSKSPEQAVKILRKVKAAGKVTAAAIKAVVSPPAITAPIETTRIEAVSPDSPAVAIAEKPSKVYAAAALSIVIQRLKLLHTENLVWAKSDEDLLDEIDGHVELLRSKCSKRGAA